MLHQRRYANVKEIMQNGVQNSLSLENHRLKQQWNTMTTYLLERPKSNTLTTSNDEGVAKPWELLFIVDDHIKPQATLKDNLAMCNSKVSYIMIQQ